VITNLSDHKGLDLLVEKAGDITGAPGEISFRQLYGDGSDRKFYRIFCGASSLIGLISPRLKEDSTDENDSYFLIGNHLYSKGLPAPRIVYADPKGGSFLLEDVGDLHLQEFVRYRRKNLETVYASVIVMLGELHLKAPKGFRPEFCFDKFLYDPQFVYERELEYFRKSFLNECLGLAVGPDELRPDFEAIAELAGAYESSHVFHRDFQSRNIMVWRSQLRLLDFQGMRFGPPAYDLASLLIDPYVRLPEVLQDKLVSMYWTLAGRRQGVSRSDFIKKFEAVRLARNLQILGAYGFLGITRAKRWFLDYIPHAFETLGRHFSRVERRRFPRLHKLVSNIRRHGLNY
jgi:aminoglycoside/choline kinase family phosphotransferase